LRRYVGGAAVVERKGTRNNNNGLRMCERGEDGDIFAMDGGVAEV
jgi:hypothetical protein